MTATAQLELRIKHGAPAWVVDEITAAIRNLAATGEWFTAVDVRADLSPECTRALRPRKEGGHPNALPAQFTNLAFADEIETDGITVPSTRDGRRGGRILRWRGRPL